VPLGLGRVVRPGSDVTVVALGHLVHDALAVADELPGISVEIFDPRTVYPLDVDGLLSSVRKTRRLVVVDDSNRTSGFAAEILAVAAERCPLAAPPRRVTRPDGAVLPFALALDRAVQPGRDQLVAAINAVLET
jgi:pyruvate/2-oxoglutarate/acetoin dehydrogenase E1 component